MQHQLGLDVVLLEPWRRADSVGRAVARFHLQSYGLEMADRMLLGGVLKLLSWSELGDSIWTGKG